MKKIARQTKLGSIERKKITKSKDEFEEAIGITRKEFYRLPIKIQKREYKAWRREIKEAKIEEMIKIAKDDLARRGRSKLKIRWYTDEGDYAIESP